MEGVGQPQPHVAVGGDPGQAVAPRSPSPHRLAGNRPLSEPQERGLREGRCLLRPVVDQEVVGLPVPPRLCPLWPHLLCPQEPGDPTAVMEGRGRAGHPGGGRRGLPGPGGPLTVHGGLGGRRMQLQQQDQPEQSRCQRGGRPPARAPHPGTGHRTERPVPRGTAEAAGKLPPAGGKPLPWTLSAGAPGLTAGKPRACRVPPRRDPRRMPGLEVRRW